jgi:hypothetical protein
MKTKHKARIVHSKLNGPFHYNPALARPRTGQRAAEIHVSEVIRTNELQVWFLAEHVVDTPQVLAE